MKPKNQMCKCGYEELEHHIIEFPTCKKFASPKGDSAEEPQEVCDNCEQPKEEHPVHTLYSGIGCSSFEPKNHYPWNYTGNHSPQGKNSEKSLSDVKPAGTLNHSPPLNSDSVDGGTLSDKIVDILYECNGTGSGADDICKFIRKRDKDFIQKLKEEFKFTNLSQKNANRIFNKLAGSELI